MYAMSSLTECVSSPIEESVHLKNQVNHDTHPAVSSKRDLTAANTAMVKQKVTPFDPIQRLDTLLQVNVKEKKYDEALENALKMQTHMSKSHYGYHRAAQIHLIRNDYSKAFLVYHQGYKEIVQGKDFELLRKSAKEALHIFDNAAGEFAKASNFDKANRIAIMMIRLVPESQEGYLRASKVYEMQGKSDKAMKVLEVGVEHVSPDCRSLLNQRKSNLQLQSVERLHCDFITWMPPEIVLNILQSLSTQDLINCMDVSKSWKAHIQQSPEIWRAVTLQQDDVNSVAQVHAVMPFVKSITVGSFVDPDLVQSLLASIENGDFINLVSLELDESIVETYTQHCTRVFGSVHLTAVSLTFWDINAPIRVDQVLKLCPHLKHLSFREFGCIPNIKHDLLPKEPTAITWLEFGGVPVAADCFENLGYFIPLITLFPNLVRLCLSNCNPGDLPRIVEGFPCLRLLIVSENHDLPQTGLDQECPAPGLKHLIVEGVYSPPDVADIVIKNSNTLETVILSLFQMDDSGFRSINTDWNITIPKFNGSALKIFEFTADYYWPIETWIGDCPCLQDVSLRHLEYLEDTVFDTLKKLPKLRKLRLDQCIKLTSTGLLNFFSHLSKAESKLDTVDVKWMNMLTAKALVSMLAIKSLRTLCIFKCDMITDSALEELATNIASDNQLKHLSLRCLDDVSEKAVVNLVYALPQLQSLTIQSLRGTFANTQLKLLASASTATNLSAIQNFVWNDGPRLIPIDDCQRLLYLDRNLMSRT